MRSKLLFPLMILLGLVSVACSESRMEVEYMPVYLDSDQRMTLMSPDGSTVDYDFKGYVSPVVNGCFTVNGKRGYDVYRFGKKKAELIDGLESLYWAGTVNEGLIPFRRKDDGKLEVADTDGEVRFSLGRDVYSNEYFMDGMLILRKSDTDTYESKWGAVNTKGEIAVKIKYSAIHDFREGCAPANIGEKWILIDRNGEKLADMKGVEAVFGSMVDGRIPVRKNDYWGFWKRDGEFTRLKSGLVVEGFNGRYALVFDDESGEWGVVDTEGTVVIPVKYDYVQFYGNDRFIVKRDDERWELLDTDGEKLFTIREEKVMSLKGVSPYYSGDFLIGGGDGRFDLYNSDGEKISGSRFNRL